MSKKLEKDLKKTAKQFKLDEEAFVRGGAQARHYYDSALIKIFGRKIGLLVSNYLIDLGLKSG